MKLTALNKMGITTIAFILIGYSLAFVESKGIISFGMCLTLVVILVLTTFLLMLKYGKAVDKEIERSNKEWMSKLSKELMEIGISKNMEDDKEMVGVIKGEVKSQLNN